MSGELNPDSWAALPDEIGEHVEEMQDDSTANRLNFFETDHGWCVQVVHRTAGACDAIARTFMLPALAEQAIAEIHGDTEDRIIWRSGLGVQVVIHGVTP